MKKTLSSFLLALLVAGAAASAFPAPVRAALSILSVSPNLVVNNTANSVTITGEDFDTGSTVTVSVGSVPVNVTSSTATELVVSIPAGFAPGVYSVTVTVSDPGPSSVTLASALTVTAPPSTRPQVVIESYWMSVDAIRFGQEFKLNIRLDNAGGSTAYGIQVTFTSAELLMLKNGGVIAAGNIDTVAKTTVSQTMTLLAPLSGVSVISLEMNVSYSDAGGGSFSEKFTLILSVAGGAASGGVYATVTPAGLRRPQLVITSYTTDVDPLQPGERFSLNLFVQNMGNVAAKGVTMIVGGGAASGSGDGTAQPGISGAGGEFTNFAPLGTSNVQSLGDFQPNASLTATQKLIVNVSTNPGAYPMKIAFSYLDDQGNRVTDEQVITLLVYSLPNLDVGFYLPVGTLMAGQPGPLPLQVVNLGRRSAVLGKMRVESAGGMVENGEMLVGPLEAGGYFTMDSMIYPDRPGALELTVTIEYTDDFNQARTVVRTLTLDVMEAPLEPTPDPSMPDGWQPDGPSAPENFWGKLWRFILGLLGLDSAAPAGPPLEMPGEEFPLPGMDGGGIKG